MQPSKADELFSIQCLLWRALGLDAAATSPAQLQAAALPTCAAAARAICLKAVSCGSQQHLGIQRRDACKALPACQHHRAAAVIAARLAKLTQHTGAVPQQPAAC